MRAPNGVATGRRGAAEREARARMRAEAAERLYAAVDELLAEGERLIAESEEEERRALAGGGS